MHKRTFVNELPAIKWKCRVSLGNGKLCERMDRYKCPFHGRIIARNDQGQPEDENIRRQEDEQRTKKRAIPEWQDPEMLEDIRLATGIDLRINESKKKKKKKKESGLTELGLEENTARKRLERKILNRYETKTFNLGKEKTDLSLDRL
jgi:Fe-S cluster assembly ATPase SufC